MKGGKVMKNRAVLNWLIIFLGVIAIMGFGFTPAFAETIGPNSTIQSENDSMLEEPGPDLEISDDNFGQNYQYTWVPIFSFIGVSSNTGYEIYGNYIHFTSGTDKLMAASINLPSGAFLSLARFYYYDNHAGSVTCSIYRNTFPNTNTSLQSFTSSGAPGYVSAVLNINHTIQNGNGNYNIYVWGTEASHLLGFSGVRLFWKRQIRTGLPHPFNDIGGLSQNFQDSIAALYQSGITTGTTPTTYSPGNPVTRAQMAAFLARALGLHWAYPY
jgi:S-layer homology domain